MPFGPAVVAVVPAAGMFSGVVVLSVTVAVVAVGGAAVSVDAGVILLLMTVKDFCSVDDDPYEYSEFFSMVTVYSPALHPVVSTSADHRPLF